MSRARIHSVIHLAAFSSVFKKVQTLPGGRDDVMLNSNRRDIVVRCGRIVIPQGKDKEMALDAERSKEAWVETFKKPFYDSC